MWIRFCRALVGILGAAATTVVATGVAALAALVVTVGLYSKAAKLSTQVTEETDETLALVGRALVPGAVLPAWFPAKAVESEHVAFATRAMQMYASDTAVLRKEAERLLDSVLRETPSPALMLLRGLVLRKLEASQDADSLFRVSLDASHRGVRGLAHAYVGLRYAEVGDSLGRGDTRHDSLHRCALDHYRAALVDRVYLGQEFILWTKSQVWWSRVKIGEPRRAKEESWFTRRGVWVVFALGVAAAVVGIASTLVRNAKHRPPRG